MPPRHAYWTILIDNQPTAFRAHDPEELLPTLNRLREKNESAVMKWFERGQLFESRDDARQAGYGQGERRWEGPRPERKRREGDEESDARQRDKNWRPGGEHRDPRQPYKDAKKAKWTRFKAKIRERHEQRLARDPETFSPPHGDPLRAPAQRDERPRPKARDDRSGPPRERFKNFDRETRDGKPTRPHGDKFRDRDRDRGAPFSGRDRQFQKPFGAPRGRAFDDRDFRGSRDDRDFRGGREERSAYSGRPRGPKADRPPYSDRPRGPKADRPPYSDRPRGPKADRPPYSDRPRGPGKFGFSDSRPTRDRTRDAKAGQRDAPRKPWSGRPAPGSRKPKRRRDDE
jgi:hypothetical protein